MTQYEQWDESVGIIPLYTENVLKQLQQCYPIWTQQPERCYIEQIINGGCVFYQYNSKPYVISLGLKDKYKDQPEPLKIDELQDLIGWFARFGDILCRNCCMEDWYYRVILDFKLSKCQYIKSFFTILSNMAYCIKTYDDFLQLNAEGSGYLTIDKLNELKANFEELVVFEITRDYKNELQQMQEIETMIKDLIQKQQNEELQQDTNKDSQVTETTTVEQEPVDTKDNQQEQTTIFETQSADSDKKYNIQALDVENDQMDVPQQLQYINVQEQLESNDKLDQQVDTEQEVHITIQEQEPVDTKDNQQEQEQEGRITIQEQSNDNQEQQVDAEQIYDTNADNDAVQLVGIVDENVLSQCQETKNDNSQLVDSPME